MCNDIFKKLKALYEIRRFTVLLMLFSFKGLQIHIFTTLFTHHIICSFVDSFLINYSPTLHIIRVSHGSLRCTTGRFESSFFPLS